MNPQSPFHSLFLFQLVMREEEDAFSPLLSQLAGEKHAGSKDVCPPYAETNLLAKLLGRPAPDLRSER